MPSTTPLWTDNVVVIPATTIAFGASARGTLDLRDKFGAWLFLRLGRKGSSGPSTPIKIQTRRLYNNGAPNATSSTPLASGNAAGQATTVNADSAAGQPNLNVASTVSFGAGDAVCIYDAAFTRLEFLRG